MSAGPTGRLRRLLRASSGPYTEELRRKPGAFGFQCNIRKGSADINSNANLRSCAMHVSRSLNRFR